MKKKCKAYTQSKFFNETTPDIMTPDIMTSSTITPDIIKDTINLITDIASKEDIVLTYSHCSTRDERLEHSICEMN